MTSETQVNKVISSLRNTKYRDAHQFDTKFLKTHKDTLASVISYLINLSFVHSVFPTAWKQAIVSPIFKYVDHCEVSNYRPISILPVVSKVIEKVVLKQLTSYLNIAKDGLHCIQFGFRVNFTPNRANKIQA